MSGHTYTEEEFKKVLKSLFAEKKRVKDLEKQLDEKGKGLPSKFQAKLADFHKVSIPQEYAQLKTQFDAQQQQLDKIKPLLKKLADELKTANATIETLKADPLREQLEEAQAKIVALEENADISEEILNLEEQLERLTKEKEELEERAHVAEQAASSATDEGTKEAKRFETERQRLVERLADELSQIQRQSEIIKDLREEASQATRRVEESERAKAEMDEKLHSLQAKLSETTEEQTQRRSSIEKELTEMKGLLSEKEQMITDLKTQLDARPTGEVTEQVKSLQQQLVELERAHEATLENSYEKMKELTKRHQSTTQELVDLKEKIQEGESELKQQVEERDGEIRKAQQHLAKKVKENTIFRDLVERQKQQIIDLQNSLTQQKTEIERLQNNLNMQRLHEEKLQTMAKERAEAAENLAKEWQEKYFVLHQEWQEAKGELQDFAKMKKNYDEMASALTNMKTFLGKVAAQENRNEAP